MAKRKRLRIVQSRAEYQEEQQQSMQSQPQSQQNLQHDFNTQVEEHVHLDQENTGHEESETVNVEGILLYLICLLQFGLSVADNAYCIKSFFIYVFIFVILDETG